MPGQLFGDLSAGLAARVVAKPKTSALNSKLWKEAKVIKSW